MEYFRKKNPDLYRNKNVNIYILKLLIILINYVNLQSLLLFFCDYTVREERKKISFQLTNILYSERLTSDPLYGRINEDFQIGSAILETYRYPHGCRTRHKRNSLKVYRPSFVYFLAIYRRAIVRFHFEKDG